MTGTINPVLLLIIGLFVGALIVFIIMIIKGKSEEKKASNIIEKAKKDAEKAKRDALLEAKEESYKLKIELDKEIKEKKQEIKENEERLLQRENSIDRRDGLLQNREQMLDEKENAIKKKQKDIQKLEEKTEGIIKEQIEKLEKISGYSKKQAKDEIMKIVENSMSAEISTYIKEKEEQGIKINYMHLFIAGVVRIIALKPRLNRFVMNGKIYTRDKIWVSFVVHPELSIDCPGTTIKLGFEGTESIFEIVEKYFLILYKLRRKKLWQKAD